MTRLPDPPVLLITDRARARAPLAEVLDAAFAAGCRWASVREKDLPAADRLALVRTLLPVARRHGAVLTVHGDLDAARRCDGVHLPGGGDVRAARAALEPDATIGLSCHGPDDVRRAAEAGADYVTLGPVFPTDSKPGYGPALGPETVGAARRFGVPVLALGGVTPANAAACRAAGAAGIAVMGGVMAADDPAAAMRTLLRAWATAPSAGLPPPV